MRRSLIVPALLAIATCALATVNLQAQGTASAKKDAAHDGGGITKAIAVLHATKSGGAASGIVTFTKVEGGIHVQAEITGLAPGQHGFHVHEFGDCSSPDGLSTGGHFNPGKMEHGARTGDKRHVGDLGNIEANASGTARVDFVDAHLTFSGHNSILGRGLIVHEKPDDYKQPTGNAGGRVACGVIGVGKAN